MDSISLFLYFTSLFPINDQMKITISDNLYIRPVEVEDALVIFTLIEKYRDALRIWLPFIDYTNKWEDTRDFIRSVLDKHPDEKEDVYGIVLIDELVGLIGFRSTDRPNRRTEIGYWIAPVYEGKGTVTQCCAKLIDFCFCMKDFNRISIRVAQGNTRSSNIPKKLGFVFEGIEREGEYLNDHYTNLEVYSLLKKEWVKKVE